MFAIFATINIKPGLADEFAQAGLADAQGAVRDEPGCFRFDILRDAENPNRFYLYEVYRDAAAFEAHQETPHFKTWLSTAREMFDGKPVRIDMSTAFPSDEGWEKQKPALLNW